MINALGVLGWGVGGIEAEAVMLGQPYFMLLPEVVGMKFTGVLAPGCTATDLVLTVTQILRNHGVVDKFVEFYGPGLQHLPVADRATIANMAPEYGATCGFFPVDAETIKYLERTGRDPEASALVESYCRAQRLFHTADTPEPQFNSRIDLDLSTVVPRCRRAQAAPGPGTADGTPQELRIHPPEPDATDRPRSPPGDSARRSSRWNNEGGAVATSVSHGSTEYPCEINGEAHELHDGSVVIAAITSCTNTSNPSVMVGAGLLARKAAARGLKVRPWVKTSMAPGSRVVTGYLDRANLTKDLDALGFQTVGYGCTTCIGNSGPLPEPVAEAIDDHSLVTAAVLSGNRNFEARIHPQVRANYLMSPMLVVAFALLGRVDADINTEPLGIADDGTPVFLRDIWPSPKEIADTMAQCLGPDLFRHQYGAVFDGDEEWRALKVPEGSRFAWDRESTYVQEPPFFQNLAPEPAPLTDITGARVLAILGDSVTTDHISPAGAIPKSGPAAKYLKDHGVEQPDWNTFGARRGNHEVMMRGTFGNVRIKNLIVPEKEGNWTRYFPSGEIVSIFDAAMKYAETKTPLVLLVGKEYGTGSSRDWAAKGTTLLGVRAVIAESYERIHRSNLVGMGVLPLAFEPGRNAQTLGLNGTEVIGISGIAKGLTPGGRVMVTATDPESGKVTTFEAIVRLNSPVELEYLVNGGILPRVLRMFAKAATGGTR